MNRIHASFRLDTDDASRVLTRAIARDGWGLPVVAPGAVSLTRQATRIDRHDPRLASDQGWGSLEAFRDWLDTGDAESLFRTGFAFDDTDQQDVEWFPQGLSGSADASESGIIDGRKFLVAGWYRDDDAPPKYHGDDARAYISLIDVTDMADVRYENILLIEPYMIHRQANYRSVKTHCGGIVWYGRWLFVASSNKLHVFDMDNILDLDGQGPRFDYRESHLVGCHDGRCHAAGFRYIIPLMAVYQIREDASFHTYGKYFDTLGLDRSTNPPRLVAASYVAANLASGHDKDPDHRVVVFFDLDESSGLLALRRGGVESSDAAETGEYGVQGVHAAGDQVWFCQSGDRDIHRLIRRVMDSSCGETHAWARGGEGLTYSPSTDHLWNITEYVNKRICFCIDRDSVT